MRQPGPRDARPAGGGEWLLAAIPVVLAAVVHRRALGAFFGPDDFIRLEQAAGLLPHARTLWRVVSEVWYVGIMLRLFGPDPIPFHAASLALHLLNTFLVYRLARRMGASPGAAVLAASAFGTFPLFYSVLLSAININDVMALTFMLLALMALEGRSIGRAAGAVALFALAFLSKESVLFVPFAAVLLRPAGERLGGAARRLAPLHVAGVVFAALYLLFRKHGLGTGGEAYAVGFGANLIHNAMTYSSWEIDLRNPIPDLAGVYNATAWRMGMWPLLLLALGAALFRAERRTILAGLAWWLLALVPVLPLLRHSYGHYLYIPMVGSALALAGAADGLASALRRRGRGDSPRQAERARAGRRERVPSAARQRLRAVLLIAIAIAGAAWSEVLVGARSQLRLGATYLALDPLTRKIEVAQRAIAAIGRQFDQPHGRAVVFLPAGTARWITTGSGAELSGRPQGTPSYNLVATVLDGGRAVRLFYPQIDSVVFISEWTAAYRDFYLFVQGAAGELVGLGTGPQSHEAVGKHLLANGYYAQAVPYLAAVVRVYPEERGLRYMYGIALAKTGDQARAMEQLTIVSAGGAADSLGVEAHRAMQNIGNLPPPPSPMPALTR